MNTPNIDPPTNSLVSALLTDLYQITMVYAHWKNNRHNDNAVFELFFRKNPFKGEYTVFAGLDECLKYLSHFKFSKSDIDYLRNVPVFADCDPDFFDKYLANIDCSQLRVYALKEGTLVFPKVPLLTLVGPLGIGQLIETTLLNLVNFPSLVATNACRMVVASREGQLKKAAKGLEQKKFPIMAEFGLRRAQGPDGGFTASKYSILGGFDGTSNVKAGKMLDVPIIGTNAHAYVQAHKSFDEVKDVFVESKDRKRKIKLLPEVLHYRDKLSDDDELFSSTNEGELASFMCYGSSFPNSFACIVDTYDTIKSGVRNFILVSLVLDDLGYTPKSIRLDSGDLASLSIEASSLFLSLASKYDRPFLNNISIIASNDLNESTLHELNKKQHAINIYGIGTNLVTCQEQPALGCVYKLVELGGVPRMKLSNEIEKVLIPGWKRPYRMYGENGSPLIDLLVGKDENIPEVDKKFLCRHPFVGQKRVYVVPSRVESLHHLVFDKEKGVTIKAMNLLETRQFVLSQIESVRPEILRHIQPDEYMVYVTEDVFSNLHEMWQSQAPIQELR